MTVAATGDPRRVEELLEQLERVNEELERTNRDLTAALRALEEKDHRLREDLAQARAFQQQILPRDPHPGFFDCRAVYRPVEMVGGDIYDIAELDPWAYRFLIADAPGHGVQAAMRTMIVKTEYDRIKETSMDPAQLLQELNDRICRAYPNIELPFTACCFDVLRPRQGRGAILRCASGAHPALLLAPRALRGEGRALGGEGGYLGVMPGVDLDLVEARLPPGARLLAYTDGLVEIGGACAPPGAPRVAQILQILGSTERSLEQAIADLIAPVEEAAKEGEGADDTTLIAVEIPWTSADPWR